MTIFVAPRIWTPCKHQWEHLDGLGAMICVRCGEVRAIQDWLPLGHIIYHDGRRE